MLLTRIDALRRSCSEWPAFSIHCFTTSVALSSWLLSLSLAPSAAASSRPSAMRFVISAVHFSDSFSSSTSSGIGPGVVRIAVSTPLTCVRHRVLVSPNVCGCLPLASADTVAQRALAMGGSAEHDLELLTSFSTRLVHALVPTS